MVLGLLALIVMRRLLSPSWVVIILQTLGTALMIWARVTFGRRSFHLAANPTEGGLVTTGPYPIHPTPYLYRCLLVGRWLTGSISGMENCAGSRQYLGGNSCANLV